MLEGHYYPRLEDKFLEALRHHLMGLRSKVASDFGKDSFERELADLRSDPIYPKFSFDSPEYVLIRFMGRMSISIGRRLGEIYDKIPRFLAEARFGLTQTQVAPKFDGLELDIGLRFSDLSERDCSHVKEAITGDRILAGTLQPNHQGLGIESRYNVNPNDSARLRKDVRMAECLIDAELLPIYLIFSSISPREEAISRLTRAGWTFLVGTSAVSFAHNLLGLDLAEILDRQKIKDEVRKDVAEIMTAMIQSYAFQQALGQRISVTTSTHKL